MGDTNERIAPQPAPRDTGSRPTWELVIEDIERWYSPAPLLIADMRDRDAQGRAKYGVPLTSDNGRDHLLDAYQELLDGAAYLRAEIENRGMPIGHIYRDVLQCLLHVREVIALRDFEGNLAESRRRGNGLRVQDPRGQRLSGGSAPHHVRGDLVLAKHEGATWIRSVAVSVRNVETPATGGE